MLDRPSEQSPDWERLRTEFGFCALLQEAVPLSGFGGLTGGRLVYMATPYSKLVTADDGSWDHGRSVAVEVRTARWAREFALQGVTVASPILTACAILNADVLHCDIDPLDDDFWACWCQPMLEACSAVVIPPMSGWDQSLGVYREALWALSYMVPVYLLEGEVL